MKDIIPKTSLELRVEELEGRVQFLEQTLSNRDKAQRPAPPLKKKGFVMPYGKHKGMTFDEIDSEDPQYLDWVEENIDNARILEALTLWRGV